jgi:hypothetical protein
VCCCCCAGDGVIGGRHGHGKVLSVSTRKILAPERKHGISNVGVKITAMPYWDGL